MGGVQRVLQSLLAERVSVRDLPTVLEGNPRGLRRFDPVPFRRSWRMCGRAWRASSVTAKPGPKGYIPLITLSPEWEAAFIESLVGPPEDRQLAMPPSKLQSFIQRLRTVFDGAHCRR